MTNTVTTHTIAELLQEFRHPDIVNISGRNLEIDFFYPKFNLAIEYQVFLPI
jgi:hypothetical protein